MGVLLVPVLVRYLGAGDVLFADETSSKFRGSGMPLESNAGGGVRGVEPKGGGGVSSNGDRGGSFDVSRTSVGPNLS